MLARLAARYSLSNMALRSLVAVALAHLIVTASGPEVSGAEPAAVIAPEQAIRHEQDPRNWYDARLVRIEGQGFQDIASPFDRLPARAENLVRKPVWDLSHHSAGICARFVTDASEIAVRWTLLSTNLAMPHMPATGVSGVDLYVQDESGVWRWLANGRPSAVENQANLVTGLPAGRREFALYLPLYNGVKSVEIGIPADAQLIRPGPRNAQQPRPIVFWGTSITQGGCASRPGMVHTAILGRRLNCEVVNLGFSGNGKMEAEVARLVAEIDAAVFVIDCLPNLGADEVRERTVPLVQILREKHPQTPIVLAEDRTYSDAFLNRSKREHQAASRAALKTAFEQLQAAGVERLYYLDGESQLAADGEGTVDSSHPTDLGFVQMADCFQRVLQPLVK